MMYAVVSIVLLVGKYLMCCRQVFRTFPMDSHKHNGPATNEKRGPAVAVTPAAAATASFVPCCSEYEQQNSIMEW